MSVIRKVMPTERGQYMAHLLRLDRADRYARFTGTTSDQLLERHCAAIDWSRTTLIGAFLQGELRAAIELRCDRMLWPNEAELGVSVETDLQGHGIGGTLFRRALIVARNRSIGRVHVLSLAENARMRALIRRFGGVVWTEHGEVAASFTLPSPNQFSLALEALEDGAGAFNSLLDRFSTAHGERLAA